MHNQVHFWQDIQTSFKGAMEGAVFAFTALVILGIGLPIVWHIFGESLRRRRRLDALRRRLLARGLDPGDWPLMAEAIQDTCPDQPQRLLENASLFHAWIDGLPQIEEAGPEALARIERIEEAAWPTGSSVFAPRSTRDLVPGASLNIVRHGERQDVVAGIIAEIGAEGLVLVRRSQDLPALRTGEAVHLYYPRPEAMYHAVCRAVESSPVRLQLKHAVAGQFMVRQLREFWRVDVGIPMAFRLFGTASEGAGEEGTPGEAAAGEGRGEGHLINLSGNGAALVTRQPAQRGQRVVFSLPVLGKTLHGIQAEILHITKFRNGYRYHMVFRNLDPAEQDLVVRSLFLWFRNQLPDTPAPNPQGHPVP